jgi:hypothetical protein
MVGLVSVNNETQILNNYHSMTAMNGRYHISWIDYSDIAYKAVAIDPMTQQIMGYSPEFTINAADHTADSINIIINNANYESYSVSGSLISSNQNQINHRHLVLYGANSDSSAYHPYVVRHTVSNNEGTFAFNNVPNGSYKIKVHTGFGMPVYYPGTTDDEEAGTITVNNANVENANITFNTQTEFVLAGNVRRADTDEVVGGITVTVDLFGNHHPNADSTFESISTTTDSLGNYSLTVPFGFYTLAAYSPDNTFQTQYYDHTQNPYRARVIRTFQNYTDLNFDLLPFNAEFNYSIAGTVTFNDSLPPVPLMVVAVSSDEDWEEVAMTDEFGAYNIPIYNSGDYYVIAFSPFAPPLFYENSLTWENAQIVHVENDVTNINFNIVRPNGQGPHCLNGVVRNPQGNPIPNVTVALKDNNGDIISFARSNEDGEYSILNIPAENMNVTVSALGYNTVNDNISINGDESVNYTMSVPLGNSDVVAESKKFSLNNYPNPFNPTTTISFSLASDENISLDIYNLKGQKVKSFINGFMSKGSHTVVWDGKDNNGKQVGSGIYFSRVKGEKTTSTHKMLLMK